jgi:multidrug efflux system membrane fusion protein
LNRVQPLLERGFVTAQQVDQARTAKETAQAALKEAQQKATEARQAITDTKPIEAQLDGARATLALAERNLDKAAVRSPCNGRITALQVAAGEFADAGHPLFTIIDTELGMRSGTSAKPTSLGSSPGNPRPSS